MTNEKLKDPFIYWSGEMSSVWLDSNNNKRLLQLECSVCIGIITLPLMAHIILPTEVKMVNIHHVLHI